MFARCWLGLTPRTLRPQYRPPTRTPRTRNPRTLATFAMAECIGRARPARLPLPEPRQSADETRCRPGARVRTRPIKPVWVRMRRVELSSSVLNTLPERGREHLRGDLAAPHANVSRSIRVIWALDDPPTIGLSLLCQDTLVQRSLQTGSITMKFAIVVIKSRPRANEINWQAARARGCPTFRLEGWTPFVPPVPGQCQSCSPWSSRPGGRRRWRGWCRSAAGPLAAARVAHPAPQRRPHVTLTCRVLPYFGVGGE